MVARRPLKRKPTWQPGAFGHAVTDLHAFGISRCVRWWLCVLAPQSVRARFTAPGARVFVP